MQAGGTYEASSLLRLTFESFVFVLTSQKLKSTLQLAEVLEGYREVWQRIKGWRT